MPEAARAFPAASGGGPLARLLRFELGLPSQRRALTRTDAVVLPVLLLALAAVYALAVAAWGEQAVRLSVGGRWFQSDGWRVFDDMTDFGANHHRDVVHPLFSLVSIAGTSLVRALLPVGPADAIHIVNGLAFLLWAALLYVTMRLIGTRAGDAVMLVLLAVVSAGSVFWFIVPETYILGTVSISFCLFVVALAPRRDELLLLLAAAGSLSFTLTNWIAGLAAIAVSRPVGRGAALAALSLVLVIAGWGVGKAIYPQPSSFFLLPGTLQQESDYVGHRDAGGIDDRVAGMLISPMLAPDLRRTSPQPTGPLLSFQGAVETSLSARRALFSVSALLWIVVLGCGVVALFLRRDRFSVALGMTLTGQCALHLVYGDETFLYALHFVPLLTMTLAVAATTPLRRRIMPLVCIVALLALANNLARFDEAANEPVTGYDARFDRL